MTIPTGGDTSKPILRQEQLLAPHGVFVKSLWLRLITFNS